MHAFRHFSLIFVISLLEISLLRGVSGFVNQALQRCNHARLSWNSLSLTKNGVVANTTRGDSEKQANLPRKQQILRIQTRCKEMKELNATGETLSQEYCDSILGLSVAAEEWEIVLDVLDVMKSQNLSQEHSTYRASLQACFEMGNGASAREILEAMENAQIDPDPSDIALVAASMCRNNKQENGWWKNAVDLLLRTPSPEVPIDAYDAVFACLVDEKNWKEALKLLRALERGSASDRKEKLYPQPSATTYREVIEVCLKANQIEQATRILMAMTEKDIRPTVYTFELVISALAKKQQWRRAVALLDIMDMCERPKTLMAYNTIISACSRGREMGIAKNLLSRMRKESIKPNVVTYNSLISGYANVGRYKDAMNILDQCNRDPHCSPDIYTYTNAIRACAKSRNTKRALTLYDVVKHKKLALDSYFYAAVIEACAKANMWQKALELLQEMEDKGVKPTDVIYGVTVTACGNGGQWEKALGLLTRMREKGMKINVYIYNSAIAALAKAAKQSAKRDSKKQGSGELSLRTKELLEQMKADGVKPDGFTFSSAISCYGAEGRWEEALGVMDQIRKGGPNTRPNKIAYTAAIVACGRSGKHDSALQLFQEMKQSGIEPDIVSYNALFSALRIAGAFDSASELWDEMCGKGNFTSRKASAMAGSKATPDIITLTDVIATLKDDKRVDEVFSEAVELGIVLPSPEESLDRFWEIDLSSMSFPVARAACRYVLRRTLRAVREGLEPEELSFITGVGGSKTSTKGGEKQRFVSSVSNDRKANSKREFLQEVLQNEFNPPIKSFVPKLARGTVQIDKSTLKEWIQRQQTFLDL